MISAFQEKKLSPKEGSSSQEERERKQKTHLPGFFSSRAGGFTEIVKDKPQKHLDEPFKEER